MLYKLTFREHGPAVEGEVVPESCGEIRKTLVCCGVSSGCTTTTLANNSEAAKGRGVAKRYGTSRTIFRKIYSLLRQTWHVCTIEACGSEVWWWRMG